MQKGLTGKDRLLLGRIAESLRSRGQFDEDFDEGDSEGIVRLRSLGRRAGRELGWKVRTIQTDPGRLADGRVRVYIVVERSTLLHEELQRVRNAKAIRRAFNDPNFLLGGQER